MDFNQYLNDAWSDHSSDALKVSHNFRTGFELLQKESDISEFANLLAHVFGQHLGKWKEGIHWLIQLQSHSLSTSQDIQLTLQRHIASLELASGFRNSLDEFSSSERIRRMTATRFGVKRV